MGSKAKFFAIGCLTFAGFVAVVVAGLIGLAWWSDHAAESTPPPTLASEEQTALDAILAASDLTLSGLRPIGVAANLDHEENRLAFAVEEGKLKVLSLRGLASSSLPSFASFASLETLDLSGGKLEVLPDLSGCLMLKKIDLSGNPTTDLSPLAGVVSLREVVAQDTRVGQFDALVGMSLARLDLAGSPIAEMPAALPASPGFRVNVKGCPVADPPGYLRTWDFSIRESGVVGGEQTQEGLATPGSFEACGTWKEVPQLATVSVATAPALSGMVLAAVDLEVAVDEGTLRVYLTAASDPRGLWFEKGFVEGAGGFIQKSAKIYAEASPGAPARLHGHLERIADQPFFFHVEPRGAAPVRGMRYTVSRKAD